METIVEEKYYKIARKKGSHVNTKLNSDGSKAAIQFTDEGNDLNGPVNLIEVEESELIRTEYVSVRDEPRTLKEIVWQDVVAPVMKDLLYQAMMEGYDNLCAQIKRKTGPVIKEKSQRFAKNTRTILSGIKDGIEGKTPKALYLMNEDYTSKADCQFLTVNDNEQQKVIRSKEETENIVRVMKMSAFTLVACIQMLNNTVIADDGTDPKLRLEIQRNIQTLSTNDVMKQVDLLLEEKNKGLLDEASYSLLQTFKEGYFIVNASKLPISNYVDKQFEKEVSDD